MIEGFISYLQGIVLAVLNRPVTVLKHDIVQTPLTQGQKDKLCKIFPMPEYNPGDDVQKLAYATGQAAAIRFACHWTGE